MSNGVRRRRLMASGLTGRHYYGTVTGVSYGGGSVTMDNLLDEDYLINNIEFYGYNIRSSSYTASTTLSYQVSNLKVIDYDTGETTESSTGTVGADEENIHLTYNGHEVDCLEFSGSVGSYSLSDSSYSNLNVTTSMTSHKITIKVTGIISDYSYGSVGIEYPYAVIKLTFSTVNGRYSIVKLIGSPELYLYLSFSNIS